MLPVFRELIPALVKSRSLNDPESPSPLGKSAKFAMASVPIMRCDVQFRLNRSIDERVKSVCAKAHIVDF